jgi:hypothetical protein
MKVIADILFNSSDIIALTERLSVSKKKIIPDFQPLHPPVFRVT